MSKTDILHTDGEYYVVEADGDYQIFRNVGTHAVKRASIGKTFPKAWERVLLEIERRKVHDPMVRII